MLNTEAGIMVKSINAMSEHCRVTLCDLEGTGRSLEE